MTNKLLPCPFCGGAPTWRQTKIRYCQLHGDPIQDWILGCFKPSCSMNPSKLNTTKEWAIKAWNTRQPHIAGIDDFMEDMLYHLQCLRTRIDANVHKDLVNSALDKALALFPKEARDAIH